MKKSVAFAAVVCSISTLVCGSVSVNAAGTAETVVETSTKTNEETSTETETGTEDATEATETESTTEAEVLEDGTYSADFNNDSSMFHVNEACEGKGTLTVKDGEMTIHISLESKKILNLFPGLAEDAKKDGAKLLEPTTDEVTYSDGSKKEVNGFDVPVPALNEEFDLALIGTKGKWYDHKVSVTNPEKLDDAAGEGKTAAELGLEDGTYTMEVALTGGSGRATITSPAEVTIAGEEASAKIEWSSPNYDYMVVDGEKYEPINEDGNSVFEIPVSVFDAEMPVTADTVAMSTPHEIEYTLNFHSATAEKAE